MSRLTKLISRSRQCFTHCKMEAIPPSGAYAICGECGHVYATAAELLYAYNNEIDSFNSGFAVDALPYAAKADSITFCPHCLHDF